jgi:hypothetical protein
MKVPPNKISRANRRPPFPFNGGQQFESASCVPPSLSAAVAHLWRWAAFARAPGYKRTINQRKSPLA